MKKTSILASLVVLLIMLGAGAFAWSLSVPNGGTITSNGEYNITTCNGQCNAQSDTKTLASVVVAVPPSTTTATSTVTGPTTTRSTTITTTLTSPTTLRVTVTTTATTTLPASTTTQTETDTTTQIQTTVSTFTVTLPPITETQTNTETQTQTQTEFVTVTLPPIVLTETQTETQTINNTLTETQTNTVTQTETNFFTQTQTNTVYPPVYRGSFLTLVVLLNTPYSASLAPQNFTLVESQTSGNWQPSTVTGTSQVVDFQGYAAFFVGDSNVLSGTTAISISFNGYTISFPFPTSTTAPLSPGTYVNMRPAQPDYYYYWVNLT